jgi:hypothetical protein
VVVEARADPVRALEALRRAGVHRLDLIVGVTGGRRVRRRRRRRGERTAPRRRGAIDLA